jgi:hypothetical protein
MGRLPRGWMFSAVCVLWGAVAVSGSEPGSPVSEVEFFEQEVRPILVARCSKCHGGPQPKAGLRLDSVEGLRKGSDSGPIVIPGRVDESKLIIAVRYEDPELQMPPTGKLSSEEIAVLERWVRMGAPLPPVEQERPLEAAATSDAEEWEKRRRHWAYQRLQKPSLPPVRDQTWVRTPVDAFILHRLEEAGLSPSPEADRRTLIRRLYFDLLGLPPAPETIEEFLCDSRPDAYERLVDRLLASPRYGERWGRHWLDLVRYAETLGHEFDFDLPYAWRYRDYVIRALNLDLPYHEFLVEHLAGDLLETPRRDPATGLNESIVATGFWWLGEGKHSPVDVRQEELDRLANQLEVFGKAFLAENLSCARCHDHKFDPIRAEDYYALAGFLTSSRYQQAFVDPPERFQRFVAEMQQLKRDYEKRLAEAFLPVWQRDLQLLPMYVQAVQRVLSGGEALEDLASKEALDVQRLRQWVELLSDPAHLAPTAPLSPLAHAVRVPAGQVPFEVRQLAAQLEEVRVARRDAGRRYRLFEDFSAQESLQRWFVTGPAFEGAQLERTHILLCPSLGAVLQPPGVLHSAVLSRRLEGEARSPTFIIEQPYLHVYAGGRGGRFQVIIDGFAILRDPLYGGLTVRVNNEHGQWYSIDLSPWLGHRAYLEILDSSVPTLSYPLPEAARRGEPTQDYIFVDAIFFSDQPSPPPDGASSLAAVVLQEAPSSLSSLAEAYGRHILGPLELETAPSRPSNSSWDDVRREEVELLNLLWERKLLTAPPRRNSSGGKMETSSSDALGSCLERYVAVELQIPAPQRAPALADGTGWDEPLLVRGDPRSPRSAVPRRFWEIFGGSELGRGGYQGSGRLELAGWVADPERTPLVPRVIVNRAWHYHLGRGLVGTPDDFGHLGEPPTHPELLEWLAVEFVDQQWSLKRLHRLIVTSSTFRMSSQASSKGLAVDPANRLWHHVPLRRLEAEAIRDALLAVSGRLDLRMGGPSVLPYLTPFMEGRGRPSESGPLDGAGRRSVYLAVRRNFLNPLLLAFDFPVPLTTIGRRGVSNVPAQALALLNNPFVVEQTRLWAQRLLWEHKDRPAEEMIRILYLEAFGRPPQLQELQEAVAFIQTQSEAYGSTLMDPRPWADLCHVLINVKEFIYVR